MSRYRKAGPLNAECWRNQGRLAASLLLTLLLFLVPPGSGWAYYQGVRENERIFDQCFLYADSEGVWLGEPIYAIGMIGTGMNPPVQIDPTLAEKLMPLVMRTRSEPGRGRTHDVYWLCTLPKPERPEQPLVLLDLEAQMRPRQKDATTEPGMRHGQTPDVVVSARIRTVEFVTPAWREAFERLDKTLNEIVELSHAAPGTEKRTRLAAQVETCRLMLQRMDRARPTQDDLRQAGQVAPNAQRVRTFQRHVAQHWARWLRQFASQLSIFPVTALPAEPRPLLGEELIVQSTTSTELLREMKGEQREELLESSLASRRVEVLRDGMKVSFYLPVYYRDLEAMTQAEFDALRRDIQQQRAERKKYQARDTSTETTSPQAVEPWGVRVQRPDAGLLTRKLLLGGLQVVDRLPDEPRSGLEPGDIIIEYSLYDLAMGRDAAVFDLLNEGKRKGKLKVLRNERVIEVAVPKE